MDPSDPEVRRRSRRRRGRQDDSARTAYAVLSLARPLLDIAVVAAFMLLIAVAPLPMGGNRDWAWAPMVLAVGAIACLVAAGLGGARGATVLPDERVPLLALIGCFALFLLVSLLQMSTMAPATPSAPFYAKAREILGQAHEAVPTLAVDASRNVLLKSMACGLIFLIARAICLDPRYGRLLLFVFAGSALIVATYGLISQATTSSCYVGGFLKKQGDFAFGFRCLMSGTFVNSNSFACFIGMGLVAVLALLFGRLGSARAHVDDDDDAGAIASWFTGTRLALIAIALLFLGVLLISGSRAGFAATILGVLVLGVLLMRGRWNGRLYLRRSLVIGGIIAVVVGLISGGAIVHKFANLSETGSVNRIYIWRAALEAIGLSPWLGWGRGEFADIYTVLQPIEIPQANDLAHSTPLETMVELGIPGAIPAFAVVLLPWGICLLGALRRQRHRYLPASAFAASAVAIVHSTVDFSLQMPAIAFVTSALLGMGWAQAFSRREAERASPTTFHTS
jgi:O-antigen ligase